MKQGLELPSQFLLSVGPSIIQYIGKSAQMYFVQYGTVGLVPCVPYGLHLTVRCLLMVVGAYNS